MKSRFDILKETISDKNLYGKWFVWKSLIPLIGGLIFPLSIYLATQSVLIFIFLPFYVLFILLCALPAKNVKSEFHPVNFWVAYILLISSMLVAVYPFVAILPIESISDWFQFLLIFVFSQVAWGISVAHLIVLAYRHSLRHNLGLRDDFFEKE